MEPNKKYVYFNKLTIYFRVPISGTRSRDVFGRVLDPNAYSYKNCLPRMMKLANSFSTKTYIFFQSQGSFKNSLRKYMYYRYVM